VSALDLKVDYQVNCFLGKLKTLRHFLLLCLLLNCSLTHAEPVQQYLTPKSISVNPNASQKLADVSDLKFNEFYKMPVGPKGLELTPKLISLIGKKVSIAGYMAKAEPAIPGLFVLSPIPVEMGDDDEKLVDDFPPNVIFVHTNDHQLAVPHIDGQINLTGILEVGSFDEVDGHVSTFRLELDPTIEKDLKQALSGTSTAQK
jgi:hypothetical protein